MPYRSHSWLDPRLEVRPSGTAGHGLFAGAPLEACEIVTVWGGQVFSLDDIRRGKARNWVYIGEDRLLGSLTSDESEDPADLLNHSCDPNLWMVDEVTLAARREITPGEELTGDYAMWEGNEDYVMPWACRCQSPLCRKAITGRDWRLPKLQERYWDHFSPFMNERIRKLSRA